MNTERRLLLWLAAALLLLMWLLPGCADTKSKAVHPLPSVLDVGTLYSPTSFFILHNDTMGYDYDRICDFARSKGITLRWHVADNMATLINWLKTDVVQVLAYEIPITAEYRKQVHNCGAANVTYQVLIQPAGDSVLTDVTQLVGRDVYVEKGSRYESRLRNLDNELGGGIRIHTFTPDTLMPEDLIEKVACGELPLTVVDSDIAQLGHTYVDSVDISLRVSFGQRSSWAVSHSNRWLGDSIDAWAKSRNAQAYSKTALRRYFEISKHGQHTPADSDTVYITPPGAISPFDSLFRHYGNKGDFDWRLLAAIGYVESAFDPHVVSWAGARGIMQLMPSTAKVYGVPIEQIEQPEANICAAVKCLNDLRDMFKSRIESDSERLKFILASYNAGAGHIIDAIELARKYDKDPELWDENVEECILWKSNPQFYNDSVCHFGYCRGKETVEYVAKVEQQYLYYKNKFDADSVTTKHKKKHEKNKNRRRSSAGHGRAASP